MATNPLPKMVASDHLKDVELEAESRIGFVEAGEELKGSNVMYRMSMTFRVGGGAVTVDVGTEETPLTFPVGLTGVVVPEVFQQLAKAGSRLMAKAMEGVFDDSQE